MARAIWSGAISFGLVNVPVKLFSATETRDVSFHQFQEGTGQRIRYRRVAEESGEEVGYDDIVKGFEIDKGRHVMVSPEELESVEPGKTRTIEIEDFVDLRAIDPVYYEKTYYLAPAKGSGAEKSYALLRRAMEDADKVAIARFVLRTKQYLAAIRPARGVLVLETMFFADEVRDPSRDIDEVPGDDVELGERERRIATQLIDSLTSDWEPERYHDTYREKVLELIGRKAEGDEIVVERAAAEGGEVIDLMAALEASVAAARQERRRPGVSPDSRAGEEGGQAGEVGEVSESDNRWKEMSKDELYDEAQRRDIAGRSSMSKEELAEALRQAS
ncbi:MAG: Ku protein [Acidimicrobiia bacterium]|nr:Ku protein [Acidimicrobiia bacterium]